MSNSQPKYYINAYVEGISVYLKDDEKSPGNYIVSIVPSNGSVGRSVLAGPLFSTAVRVFAQEVSEEAIKAYRGDAWSSKR